METKRVISARFVDVDTTRQMRYHGNQTSDFPIHSLCVGKINIKSSLAIICFHLTFSTIFLLNNGYRTIKVNVDKVQYCRAGHDIVT